MKKRIIGFIDFFYPPFSRLMPIQTFRYAACGGSNTLMDILLYYVAYNYVLHQQDVNLGLFTIAGYVLAFLMSFSITFPTGFFLMRYIVFPESSLHGRVQLFRYFLLVIVCLGLKYGFIKLFVERLHIYPSIANVLTTFIIVGFSYLTQKHFTFKTHNQSAE